MSCIDFAGMQITVQLHAELIAAVKKAAEPGIGTTYYAGLIGNGKEFTDFGIKCPYIEFLKMRSQAKQVTPQIFKVDVVEAAAYFGYRAFDEADKTSDNLCKTGIVAMGDALQFIRANQPEVVFLFFLPESRSEIFEFRSLLSKGLGTKTSAPHSRLRSGSF